MVVCGKCNENLVEEDILKCCRCSLVAHFYCVGQTQKNFLDMKKKDKYKCITCKSNSSPPGNANLNLNKTIVIDANSGAGLGDVNVTPPAKVSNLQEFFEEKFRRLEEMMIDMKSEIKSEINKRCTLLENELKEKDKKIEELEFRIEDMELRNRMSNIEIRNVPETEKEDCVAIVQKIGQLIGMGVIGEGDIQLAHRVYTAQKNGIKPIVALLGSRYLRNKWLTQYKEFKASRNYEPLNASEIHSGFNPSVTINIFEHLTINRKVLLNEVRNYAKDTNIKYVWVRDGVILIKKYDVGKTFRITNHIQFDNVKNLIHAASKK